MAQIVGQVELEVVPNDQNFNRNLQQIIDKASSGVKSASIKPNIDTSGVEAGAAKLTQSANAAADQATAALSGITPDMDTRQFEAAAAQVEEAAEGASSRASASFSRIAIGVGVAAAAMYGLKQASDVVIGSLSKLFDNLLKAEAGFEAILGQAQGNKLLADIQEFARVTPFSTEGLVQYSQQLLGVGRSAESIIPTLQSVGDLVASKGGDTNTINRVLFTLTQIQSVGRLIGQDALQLQSALIPITKLLADSMGKTQAEIKKLSAAGKISADTVFKTLEEAGLDVAGAMEGATRNIGGAKEGLLDTVTILAQKSPVLQSLNADIVQAIKNLTNFLGSDRVADITDDLSAGLEKLYKSMQPVFSQLSAVSGEIALTFLEAATPLVVVFADVISSIPIPVLTALGTLLAFNKFQTFVKGFGQVVSLFQNFQGLVGRVAGGLGQTSRALAAEQITATQTAAVNQNLARSYSGVSTATATATAQTNTYTAALERQRNAALRAASTNNTSRLSGARGALGRSLAPGGAGGAALGAVGFLGLTQRDNVDGAAGQALGIGATTATAAALGAQVGGPYGAAIGTAAGLGFGIFQEFNKKAREEAEAKAEEWGAIGEKSATEFSEGFAREYNVDTTEIGGPAATQSERTARAAQTAADIILLNDAAANLGVITPEVEAAAARLKIDLKKTESYIEVGAYTEQQARDAVPSVAGADLAFSTPSSRQSGPFDPEINPAYLAPGQGLFGFEAEVFDVEAYEIAAEQYKDEIDAQAAEIRKKQGVVDELRGNDLAASFFADGGEGYKNITLQSTGQEIEAENTRVMGAVFDQLQKFGISLEDAIKLGDKIAFYFSDVLKNVQESVDASTQWNTKLEEAKATLEGINKERIKEASSRLALLNQEEEFQKKLQGINEDTASEKTAQLVIDALKLAENQAAQTGGTIEEIAARQSELFGTALNDIREQGNFTDETFREILDTVGLLDDYEIASQDQIDKVEELTADLEELKALQGNADPAASAAIQTRINDINDEIEALDGLSTAESRAQDARDRRNANALQVIKSNEAMVGTYSDLAVATVLGESTLSQFGDAAVQAFELSALKGADAAETNQLFVDSLENIQLVLGYSDQELREYLESVGLLDAYNKALEGSNIGVQTTIAELGTTYEYNTELLRTLLGVADSVDNDITIYVTAETQAALAQLRDFREEYQRIQNDESLTPAERFRQSQRVKAQDAEARAALEANGVDINATAGSAAEAARRAAEEQAENAAREAEKIARENERIADEAERAADALQNSIDSASSTLQNAIEEAAAAVEQAAEAWKSDIKERTQYDPAVSASRLANNADRQATDLTELTAGISTLRARGVSQEVLDALGIDNVADLRQVRKLVGSNDSDLARLTESVSTRDKLATSLAKSEEDKRNRDNITTAIVAAASILGFDDFDPNRASSIANNINIDQGADTDALTAQILGLLSGGKIGR